MSISLTLKPPPSHAHLTRTLNSRSSRIHPCPSTNPSMPQVSIKQLIQRIISAPPAGLALCLTGGATQAASWLTTVPGASSKILEITIPYAQASTIDYLGSHLTSGFTSDEAAVQLAKRAYQRAAAVGLIGVDLFGISATCALATDRRKAGDHRVIVGVHGAGVTVLYKLKLQKDVRDRVQEDDVASRLVLGAIGEAYLQDAGCMDEALGECLMEGEKVEKEKREWIDPLDRLMRGEVDCVEFSGGTTVVDAPRRYTVLLPGSFNPLHEGHRGMLAVAERVLGLQGCFELSISNPDKKQLSREDVMARVEQFVELGLPIVVTNRSLFVQKTALFETCTFLVGYDTAVRLVNPKYYGGSFDNMMNEFSQLRKRRCKFCVVGRLEGTEFRGLEDIELPSGLEEFFSAIPESDFRKDISSTELRRARGLE